MKKRDKAEERERRTAQENRKGNKRSSRSCKECNRFCTTSNTRERTWDHVVERVLHLFCECFG